MWPISNVRIKNVNVKTLPQVVYNDLNFGLRLL